MVEPSRLTITNGFDIIVHEEFVFHTVTANIALIHLDNPISITKEIAPVCLPSEEVTPGTECAATGWATTAGS